MDAARGQMDQPIKRTAGSLSVAGRFRLTRVLADDPGCPLYLGEDIESSTGVAVRVFAPGPGLDAAFRERVRAHARIVSMLAASHPTIAPVVECTQSEDGGVLVATARPDGPLLADLMRGAGGLGLQRALTLGLRIAEALEAAHNMGVVHGGLDPTAIVALEGGDGVVLLDFGFRALPLSGGVPAVPTDGVSRAAPYLAPEQRRGGQATERGDVYALGGLLFHMLTGGAPPPPGARLSWNGEAGRRRAVPGSLRLIVSRALAEEPQQRHRDITELLNYLWMELNALSGTAALRWRRARWRVLRGALTVALVVGLIGVGVLWLRAGGARWPGRSIPPETAPRVEEPVRGPASPPLAPAGGAGPAAPREPPG
ncbi:MAG: protein kinase, partial [Candidatus Rokubacteria bacterium]|nr:protein kinase [Candidatus Rokubacteria bacterium]